MTDIKCKKMSCGCYPNRLLCEPGGVDLTDWFASKEEGPVGPATLQCAEEKDTNGIAQRQCTFKG